MHIVADNPNIIFDTIDGEMVMINLDNGSYYTMNESGAALWALLQHTSDAQELTTALAASGVEATATAAFLAQLQDEGLARSAAAPQGKNAKPAPPGLKSTEAPQLSIFRDMKDLLLLDPVHEISEQGWPYTKPAA